MLTPTKGKYLCELLKRERQLPSGLWLAERIRSERRDNIARLLKTGKPTIHTCQMCDDFYPKSKRKDKCFRAWKMYPCKRKNRSSPILAQKGDIVHFKPYFGSKLRIDDKECIFLTNANIVAIEKSE